MAQKVQIHKPVGVPKSRSFFSTMAIKWNFRQHCFLLENPIFYASNDFTFWYFHAKRPLLLSQSKFLKSKHPIWYKAPLYYRLFSVYILHHRFLFSYFSPFANFSTKIIMCDPNYFRNTFNDVFGSFSIILGCAVSKQKPRYSIIS